MFQLAVTFKKEKREEVEVEVEEEEREVIYQLPWDVTLLFVCMNLETKPVITCYLCCNGFTITLVLVVIVFITVSIIVSPNARSFSQNLVLVKETIDPHV